MPRTRRGTETSNCDKKCEWSWTEEDLGWAYVRYRDDNSLLPRQKVPANFIKNYSKGDNIDRRYKYKVFWSEDKVKNTPTKYLQTAHTIPEFDENQPDECFGQPGCYRATVYTVQATLEGLNKWISQERVRDIPDKLCYTSFETQDSSQESKAALPRKKMTASQNKKAGSLKNVATLRDQLLQNKSYNLGTAKEIKKKKTSPRLDETSSDEDDPSITSPSKVKRLETKLTLQQQELRKSAMEKERMREEIARLRNMAGLDTLDSEIPGTEIVHMSTPSHQVGLCSKESSTLSDAPLTNWDGSKDPQPELPPITAQSDVTECSSKAPGASQALLSIKPKSLTSLSISREKISTQIHSLPKGTPEFIKKQDVIPSVNIKNQTSGGFDRKDSQAMTLGDFHVAAFSGEPKEISVVEEIDNFFKDTEFIDKQPTPLVFPQCQTSSGFNKQYYQSKKLDHSHVADPFSGKHQVLSTSPSVDVCKGQQAAPLVSQNQKSSDFDDNASNVSKLSKRKLALQEKEVKRAQITQLVPIPSDFKYKAEEFKISDEFTLTGEQMGVLWGIRAGRDKDPEFIKTAAVMMFGSTTLLRVGRVVGIKRSGVEHNGLDKVALEGIRVLLILRAQREGVEVKWDTERTKQSSINIQITDKIKSLRVSSALRMAGHQTNNNSV